MEELRLEITHEAVRFRLADLRVIGAHVLGQVNGRDPRTSRCGLKISVGRGRKELCFVTPQECRPRVPANVAPLASSLPDELHKGLGELTNLSEFLDWQV